MKYLSLILVFVIAVFTAKPLLSNMIHHAISEKEVAHECCGHCSGGCCGDKSEDAKEDACDTSSHDCAQDCTCVMDGIVVFTQAPSPQIELFETIAVQIETRYYSYEFSLPTTIWHPPKGDNDLMC